MAGVVVLLSAIRSRPGDPQRDPTGEGLDLRLLVDADDGLPRRRVEVEREDVGLLAVVVRIVAGAPHPHAVRAQLGLGQDALDGGGRDLADPPRLLEERGQALLAPKRALKPEALGQATGDRDHFDPLPLPDSPGTAASRRVPQGGEPAREIPAPPLRDLASRRAQTAGDLPGSDTRVEEQQDASTPDVRGGREIPGDTAPQDLPILPVQPKEDALVAGHTRSDRPGGPRTSGARY